MTAKNARALLPFLLPLSLLLLLGCAEDKPAPTAPEPRVFEVPEDYTLGEAALAARPGDTIVLTPPGGWDQDVLLPTNVEIKLNVFYLGDELFQLEAGLTVLDSEIGTSIEGLEISNSNGAGLTIVGGAPNVRWCWFRECAGPGVELIGNCGAKIEDSDFEGCTPGVLVRNVGSSGHWNLGTAPKVTLDNFIGNLGYGDAGHGPNLVFESVAAGDTVYVNHNFWQGVNDPDLTIWDRKDDSNVKGLADTELDGFTRVIELHDRWWRN